MYDRKLIKDIINHIYPECTVILFGSYAFSNPTHWSDIDILVLFENEISRNDKLRIQSEIRSALANKFIDADVLVSGKSDFENKKNLTNHIYSVISKEGVLL